MQKQPHRSSQFLSSHFMLSIPNVLVKLFKICIKVGQCGSAISGKILLFQNFQKKEKNKHFNSYCTYLSEHNSSFRSTIIFAISLLFFPTLNGRHLVVEIFVHASFILYFNFDALNFTQVTNSFLLEHGRHTSSKIFKISKNL